MPDAGAMTARAAPSPVLRALGWAVLGAADVVLACALGWWIVGSPAAERWDMAVVRAVNAAHSPATDALARGLDVLFGPAGSAVLWLLLVLGALLLGGRWHGRAGAWRWGLWTALVSGVPWGATRVVKVIVHRERPDLGALDHVLVEHPASPSFPSGHTAFATVLAATVVLALPRGPSRRLAGALAPAVVAATAWSRMALGVHHPTDVIASVLLVTVLALCVARGLAAAGLAGPRRAGRPERVRAP